MNPRHLAQQDDWMTPLWVLDKVRAVLGRIDLDPASSEMANERVKAGIHLDAAQDALTTGWAAGYEAGDFNVTIYLNPPGGKIKNKSKTALFWAKLMAERKKAGFSDAIFMCFSLEAMQSTQGYDCPSICEFPFCVPKKRIKFDYPGDIVKSAPSHSNAIVYVPGALDRTERFVETFRDVGVCVVPQRSK